MNNNPFAPLDETMLPAELSIWVWLGVKILFVAGFLFYLAFALIIIRQVHVMSKTYKTSAEPLLKLLAYLHFLFAIAVLLFVLVLL